MKALMVTVYFVGLVNFYQGNEVVIPRAPSGVERNGVMLHPHAAAIFIKGLAGGEGNCGPLLGGDLKDGLCKVAIAGGTIVTLPPPPSKASKAKSRSIKNDAGIPSLSRLCGGISDIKKAYLTDPAKYAVRTTIQKGTLNACTYEKQWVSYLTTTAGELRINFRSLRNRRL
jgi:hypothetical protein